MANNTPYTPDINSDSADFVPSMGDYKTLQPFRYWCQKVLPLVYDESLSYYELLCKVVDYLNKTMEDVETLHGDIDDMYTAFEGLQGFTNVSITDLRSDYQNLVRYVNNYFESLDVQNEINNKLDAMALNGTLNVLLAPYVPNAVTAWLNEHITPTTPVVDDTLSIAGAAAEAKTTGLVVNDLKDGVRRALLSANSPFVVITDTLENGTLNNDGEETSDPDDRSRYRTDFISGGNDFYIMIPSYCEFYGYKYDIDQSFIEFVDGGWHGLASNDNSITKISASDTAFYRFVFRYQGQAPMTDTVLNSIHIFQLGTLSNLKNTITDIPFVNGTIYDYSNVTNLATEYLSTRLQSFFIAVNGQHLILTIPNGYRAYLFEYDIDMLFIKERGWASGDMYYHLDNNTKYVRFVLSSSNGSDNISPTDVNGFELKTIKAIKFAQVNPILAQKSLIAHRGFATVAPENTLPAIELAHERGFNHVEVDLQFTLDGVCVLLHDNTINRTSNGEGNVYDMTYEQLQQYDFGSWKGAAYTGTKIPTLREALLLCKTYGMCMQLDIADTNKTNITKANLETMIKDIKDCGMTFNITVCAEEDRARKVLGICPGINICIGIGATEQLFNQRKDIADGCAFYACSNSTSIATLDTMYRVHSIDAVYQTWTINDADTAKNLFAAGYDWIITDSLTPDVVFD